MNRRRAHSIRLLVVLLIVGHALAFRPVSAPAQEPPNSARIHDEDEVAHDLRTLRALHANSRFRLFGELDRAVTSLRSKGKTAYGRGMECFTTNTGIIDAADLNMDSQPDIALPGGGRFGQYFDFIERRPAEGFTGHAIAARADISARMDSIHAVPNPFIARSAYQTSGIERRLLFTHLPPEGVLRIFTVSGAFVQEIAWGPADLAGNGDLFWDAHA